MRFDPLVATRPHPSHVFHPVVYSACSWPAPVHILPLSVHGSGVVVLFAIVFISLRQSHSPVCSVSSFLGEAFVLRNLPV